MTTGKTKGFGLVSRNAREKAAEQAIKTLNSIDTENDDNASAPNPPMEQSTSVPDPAAPISETDAPATALAPSVESTTPDPAPSVSATPEHTISETNVSKPASTRREGKNKKTGDTTAAPLNAARVSPRAHKLLNMISSLENKTQSAVIDELIVLHPLYKKLKDLV